ncbi:hypothetical protein L083_6462 [Actinoplanes sp. N902-109]|nr:hypothetical protein L083_6462 [Actinoplanes sp. N902-109]
MFLSPSAAGPPPAREVPGFASPPCDGFAFFEPLAAAAGAGLLRGDKARTWELRRSDCNHGIAMVWVI